jgi:hypothetical protein
MKIAAATSSVLISIHTIFFVIPALALDPLATGDELQGRIF